MKVNSYIGGFISGVLFLGIILAAWKWKQSNVEWDYDLKVEKVGTGGPKFVVSKWGEYMFEYSFVSNGFYIRVNEESEGLDSLTPRMYFKRLEQDPPGIIYDLATSRRLEDGTIKTVQYDVESGDIEQTLLMGKDGFKAYDKEGILIEPDRRLGEVDGQIRRPLETLEQRRKELSEKLRDFEPESNEQN